MQTKKDKSPLDKATHTWLVKNYTYKLAHPDDKRSFNRANNCVNFLLLNTGEIKSDRLQKAAKHYYYKNKAIIKSKIARVSESPKIQKLIKRYPKLDIERAFQYAVITDKISLTNDDIDFLEQFFILLKSKKPKSTKE